jgi:crotonobetainyl-CoA:carnitine CoA-transferase CaiB-like acyl-CoA transferase
VSLLHGVRVVEVAQYVAAPLAGTLLAELGADVIKIEPPTGDAYRGTMPIAPGVGRFWVPLNRGKRSVVLDLKSESGREDLRALLGTAAIVIHNSPPARAESFGLGWDVLHAALPKLVMGVVTSFGPEGELVGAPAYDLVAQARAGLLTAHASPGDTVPVRAGGIPVADLTAGFLLSTGVLAALVRATVIGIGERIEISLLAAALAAQIQDLVWLPGQTGTAAPVATSEDLSGRAQEIAEGLATNPYYRCYETHDGFLAVACLNLAQRQAFAGLFALDDPSIDAPDVISSDPVVLAAKRAITSAVVDRMAQEPLSVWSERLAQAGVPSGPVHARERVNRDPQIVANEFLTDVEQGGLGQVTMLGRLFGLAGESAPLGPAPELGADTESVLAEIGAR